AGEANQLLARRPDAGDAGVGDAHLLADAVLGGRNRLAPEAARVAQLDNVVVDEQVNRLRRPAFEEEQVVAGELQFGPPVPAGVGRGDGVGQGALGDDHVAGAARDGRAGERAGGEDQLVVRRQRLDARVEFFPEVAVADAAAADVVAQPRVRDVLNARRAAGEVDAQQFAGPAVHLSILLGKAQPRPCSSSSNSIINSTRSRESSPRSSGRGGIASNSCLLIPNSLARRSSTFSRIPSAASNSKNNRDTSEPPTNHNNVPQFGHGASPKRGEGSMRTSLAHTGQRP